VNYDFAFSPEGKLFLADLNYVGAITMSQKSIERRDDCILLSGASNAVMIINFALIKVSKDRLIFTRLPLCVGPLSEKRTKASYGF